MDDQQNEVASTSEKKEEIKSQEIQAQETQETQEPQSQETLEVNEGGEKKSRLEKRIENLQGKLSQAKTEEDKQRIISLIKKLTEKTKSSYAPFPKEPLIRQEDLEEGIDPQELERRQAAREFALKEEIKQEIQAQNEIVQTTKDHIKDYEETLKANPELDPKSDRFNQALADFVTKQYFLANTVYNPMTGQNELVPVVKTSQIVAQVKSLIEQERTKAQADVKGRISQDIQSSAIPPSGAPGQAEPPLEELQKRMWDEPEKVAEYLERKLK